MRNILGEINVILSGGKTSKNSKIDVNDMPADLKVLLVNGKTEVKNAYEVMLDKRYDFDLTSKRELKTDIRRVEKYISLIESGNITPKTAEEMEHAMIHLNTVVKGLVQFFG